jgi:hypothetical protein
MPGTLTVGCKIPMGLQLRLFRMVERSEPQPGGGYRMAPSAMVYGEPVFINGCAYAANAPLPEYPIIGEAGLTFGVDADFFAEWLKQNADAEVVKKGLIFAHIKDTAGLARESAGKKSGMERLNPDSPGQGVERV